MASEFDLEKAKKEAQKEINDEMISKAKVKLKAKMLELNDAEQLVVNVKRELEELEHEIANGLS